LIDEIDKADIDFPNDLLRELDKMEFSIEELDDEHAFAQGIQKTYRAAAPPIVIITSNDEKELPNAFLRRCLFHYIPFPAPERLRAIVAIHTSHLSLEKGLIDAAVKGFERLRTIGSLRKEPGTSELLDWVNILHRWGVRVDDLQNHVQATDLPYWELLFKHQADLQAVFRSDRHGET
jgi:MoxR-like ATPase